MKGDNVSNAARAVWKGKAVLTVQISMQTLYETHQVYRASTSWMKTFQIVYSIATFETTARSINIFEASIWPCLASFNSIYNEITVYIIP